MSEDKKTLKDCIYEQVVSDYFTPNIKAEVIIDMLLTPYIHELIDGAELVAKEMSIPRREKKFGSRGAKIDYVLAKDDPSGKDGTVFLVELKTTDSSMNGKQAADYLSYCQGKRFGDTLGLQLLSILKNNFQAKGFSIQINPQDDLDDKVWENVFNDQIMKEFGPDVCGENSAERAANLIRQKRWAQIPGYRSRKYLYTLGQITDYVGKGHSLWGNTMEVRYLTPSGATREGYPPSFSLKSFTEGAFLKRHGEEPYARMLEKILKEIYMEDWNNA